MEKVYRVQINEIDPETGNAIENVLEDTYTGIYMNADCGDGRMAEVVLHDNIFDIATRVAQGEKGKNIVRLGNVFIAMKNDATDSAEANLLRAIMGEDE